MSEFGALFPAEFHQFNDKYAHHVLDARHSASGTVAASTPTITTLSGSDFLHKLSATILGSLQLQPSRHADSLSSAAASLGAGAASTVATATGAGLPRTTTATATLRSLASNMDFDLTPNRVLVDSSSFSSMDEMQKQLEYDKFMNEIWIGIVLTLIVISLVFCVCSCFLYHQFRTWKRNYNATVVEAQAVDVEAVKLNPDREDPVPEYTLVSGLPSYEAALELLHKAPSTCVLVYPSVFNVFNRREEKSAPSNNNNNNMDTTNMQQQQLSAANESPSTPLMAATTRCEPTSVKAMRREVPSYAEATAAARAPAAVTVPSTTAAAAARVISLTCVNEKSSAGKKPSSDRTATTTTNSTTSRTYEKVPTYDDALVVKSLDSKPSS